MRTELLAALAEGAGGEAGKRAVAELARALGLGADVSVGALAEAAGEPNRREAVGGWGERLVDLLAEAGPATRSAVARAMAAHTSDGADGSVPVPWHSRDHVDFRGGVFLREVVGVQVVLERPVPEALAALPARTVGFTGRGRERAALLDALSRTGAPAVLVSAVSGLGGVGKSALAVEAAHEAYGYGWFPGGVLFVDLHGYDDDPVSAEQALSSLLGALGTRPEDLPGTADERGALYRSLLAARRAVLVLADNASSVDQVRPLLPGDGPHRVLVTSRDRLPQLGARLVPLDQLSARESYELLDRALRIADPGDERVVTEEAAARQLAELCGHLPLALQIAAALLAEDRERAVADLVDELAFSRGRLDGLDDGVRSVRAAFDMSYRRLGPEPARVLRLLAVAPGAEVSEEVLAVLLDGASAVAALRVLRRAHLVERAGVRWRSHDLVREFGAEAMSREEEEAAREKVLAYYVQGARAADRWLKWRPGKERPPLFSGHDEAMSWLDKERAGLLAAVRWTREERFFEGGVVLAMSVSEYLIQRRAFDEQCAVMEVAQGEAGRRGHVEIQADASHDLGLALAELGRPEEAADMYERALRLFGELGEHSGEGSAWDALGGVLADLGRLEEAVAAHIRARAVHEELGDRHRTAIAWANLGLTLYRLRRFEEAVAAQERAQGLFAAVGDRRLEGAAWGTLGVTLQGTGDTEGAIAAYGQALARHREFKDGYGIGQTLHNLALSYGATDLARATFHQAAEAFTLAGFPAQAASCHGQAAALTARPEPTGTPTPAAPPARTTAAAPPSPPPPDAPDTAGR
ncbi:ATP-binding protein [Streptomyces acidiscabies]|uniref:ATP-binding protein n=1 Tax=Streptomyces acidiscabies TaxID=42234 RepID=UPI0038F624C2